MFKNIFKKKKKLKNLDDIRLFKLLPHQEKNAEAIEWLLDPHDHIAEGRSYLMACCFGRLAIKYSPNKIKVFDHIFPDSIEHRKYFFSHTVMPFINDINKALKETRRKFTFNGYYLDCSINFSRCKEK